MTVRPQGSANRSIELDALIVRWFTERPEDFQRRVLDRLNGYPDSGCWQWSRGTTGGSRSYGRVHLPATLDDDGRTYGAGVLVHRVVWLYLRGPIPYGMVLDHDDPEIGCHDRSCAQPEHLVVSSVRDNTVVNSTVAMAARHARKTHCPNNHPLDGPGADLVQGRSGRHCRTCAIERTRLHYQLLKQAFRALGLSRKQYAALFGETDAMAESVLWAGELCRQAAQPSTS
jgi:HNH endonuclease